MSESTWSSVVFCADNAAGTSNAMTAIIDVATVLILVCTCLHSEDELFEDGTIAEVARLQQTIGAQQVVERIVEVVRAPLLCLSRQPACD